MSERLQESKRMRFEMEMEAMLDERGCRFVPLSVRSESRIVTWLWRHTHPFGWLTYPRARRLARWLP